MSDLADRYGSSASRSAVVVGLAALLVLGFGAWLAWATWSYADPQVRSELVSWEPLGEHQVTARVEVRVQDDAVVATCVVRAFAEDHTVVGEQSFEATAADPGTREVSVRTERRATAVENAGCTTPEQSRPR